MNNDNEIKHASYQIVLIKVNCNETIVNKKRFSTQ